ncbi:SWI/SNF COMPLEX-RELATED [Salix purpurea]|uniref:SWI/SNF COMPLEX-RELATED n=1 Tax=Salix purpurea TaxID=77065 RepID=A0A9Q0PEM2_SALPP|nr:SWI/SNF COMPLEX-RELATED [Salix purpurea]
MICALTDLTLGATDFVVEIWRLNEEGGQKRGESAGLSGVLGLPENWPSLPSAASPPPQFSQDIVFASSSFSSNLRSTIAGNTLFHHYFLARNWSLCVRFVAADFLIPWSSNKTTALLGVLSGPVMDTYSSGEDLVIKTRKPYTITKQRERWTEEEHNRFLEALKLYGRAWQRIERTYWYKDCRANQKSCTEVLFEAYMPLVIIFDYVFVSKLEREAIAKGVPIGHALEINIPPPRPKKKPGNPYPRKKGVGPPASQVGAKDGKLLTSTSFPHCRNVLELVKEPRPEKRDGDERPTNAKENQNDNCSEVFTLLQEAHCSSVASSNKNSVSTLEVLKKTSSFREFVPSSKKGNHDAQNESFITIEHEANQKLDSSDAKQTAWDNGIVKASKSENSCSLHEKFFQQKKSHDFIGSLPTDEMQAMQNYPRHVPVQVLDGSLGTCMETPPSDLSFQDSMFHPIGNIPACPILYSHPARSTTTDHLNNSPRSSMHQSFQKFFLLPLPQLIITKMTTYHFSIYPPHFRVSSSLLCYKTQQPMLLQALPLPFGLMEMWRVLQTLQHVSKKVFNRGK